MTMIESIIRFSAERRMLVILLIAGMVLYAGYTLRQIRLDAIPDLSDTQVIVYTHWDRSPDILEDQVTYPIITALLGAPQREGHPRLQRFRLLLRLRDLPGRHGHLLGAQPRGRVPVEDPGQPAAGRDAGTRAGRDRRGLGVPVRAGGQAAASTTPPS